MRAVTWALSTWVVVLAACGDDDGGSVDAGALDATVDGSTDAGGGALADAWCPDFAARICAASERCGCDAIPGFGEEAACLERAERTCRVQLARFAEEPRIELASAVPEGCAAALDEALADCRMPENDTFAVRCPLAWPRDVDRTLPSSGACVEGLCAEGARCSSEGACGMPSAGAACGSVGDCPDGDRCGDDGMCRALSLEGSGTSCAGPEACSGDLRCLAATRRECVAKEAGGPCVGDEACVAGEYCAEGTCTTSPGLGLACGNGTACAAGLACRASDGTCRAFPTTGEPCALGALGPFLCAEGLACREGICGAVPTDGETCATGDVRCAEGLGCHFEADASVCRPRVGAGAECGLDDTCEAGLFCDFGEGRCAAVLAEGEVCRDGNECGPDGACVPDETATTFRCVPRPSEGEACFLDDTCEPGFVCRSPFGAGICAPPVCSAFVF